MVTQNAAGNFTVTDKGAYNGTFAVANGLTINTLHGNDSITVTLAAGKLLPGTLSINSQNGQDSITINGGGSGRVGGNMFISGSNGNDSVAIGLTSGIRISGVSVLAGGAGNDTFSIGAATLGQVSATQVNLFTLGAAAAFVRINGDLTIDNTNDFGAANTIDLNSNSGVAGSFKYTGGTGSDAVTVAGFLHTVAGKETVLNTREGNSSVTLTGTVGVSALANLTFNGSKNVAFGTDQITISPTASVSNNMTLNMGHETHVYNLASNFFVGGNFTLTAGSGSDNVGAVDGVIGGDAGVNLGSGDDSIQFGTLGAGVGSIGGNLIAELGDGDDSISINVPITGTVVANLGVGADIFDACDPVNSSYGAATIDFGVDADNDTSTVLVALSFFTMHVNVGGGDVILTC